MIWASTPTAAERQDAGGDDPDRCLRVSEKLVLGFFVYAALASLVFPLSARERVAVAGLNLLSTAVIFSLRRLGYKDRSAFLAAVRNWFPCVLILLAYRESGLFYIPDPGHRLDYLFESWDTRLLANPWVLSTLSMGFPWLQRYLEFSYLLCYPIVPLGLASLYLAHDWPAAAGRNKFDPEARTLDHFWTAVLIALFSCFILFPLFPSTPPRSFFHDSPGPAVRPLFRTMNFWILGQYGIHSSVFPSGHVAGVTAAALSIRHRLPRTGVLFLVAALSIAAATVYGRYHYAADAVAGAAIGLGAFLISLHLHKP